jgi:hypothetical protein
MHHEIYEAQENSIYKMYIQLKILRIKLTITIFTKHSQFLVNYEYIKG